MSLRDGRPCRWCGFVGLGSDEDCPARPLNRLRAAWERLGPLLLWLGGFVLGWTARGLLGGP